MKDANMFFWKRWKPWASLRRKTPGVGAAGDAAAPVCQRPDQAGKCFKLDYILNAFALSGSDAQRSMRERCSLCAAVGSAEPWDPWEHSDHYKRFDQYKNLDQYKHWTQ